jgi:hypothetical protein
VAQVDGVDFEYEAVEVGLWNRVYRTWKWPGMLDEEHCIWAMLALVDVGPISAKKVETELD